MSYGKNRVRQGLGVVSVLLLLAGVGMILYPLISSRWNALHESMAIHSYQKIEESRDGADLDLLLENAERYNRRLAGDEGRWEFSEERHRSYMEQLNPDGGGLMGYIRIPVISASLPIYHGTDDQVLAKGIGHLEGSSLPVGGKGTHSVLSGHRGLPTARLFTDLDKVKEGDVFMIHVLNRELVYKIDRISVVVPEDTSLLSISEDDDYCTLMTCTPYGVNSHRLLLRGSRVCDENPPRENRDDGNLFEHGLDSYLVPAGAAFILIIISRLVRKRKHGRRIKITGSYRKKDRG
ncbi:MAG: class C sortase [Lachnospiraceae bacterium]